MNPDHARQLEVIADKLLALAYGLRAVSRANGKEEWDTWQIPISQMMEISDDLRTILREDATHEPPANS